MTRLRMRLDRSFEDTIRSQHKNTDTSQTTDDDFQIDVKLAESTESNVLIKDKLSKNLLLRSHLT